LRIRDFVAFIGVFGLCNIIVKFEKAREWIAVALLLFVIICYGIYLLQSYSLGLNYAIKYSQYINQVQAIQSLYLFGKLGLIAFTIVESGILLGYVRSGMFSPKEFLYLLTIVIVTNLLVYVIISIIYEYANAIIG